MKTVSSFLASSMNLPKLKNGPVELNGTHYCALTGQKIAEGYPVGKIITGATGDTLGLMSGNIANGYLSPTAARCFKGIRNVGGILVFEDGTFYKPLISRTSASKKEDRPCWSDLVREVWPRRAGERMVCVLSTDPKKRTWPRAFVSVVGDSSRAYIYDAPKFVKENIMFSWKEMINVLDFIEEIYTAGFSKENIENGLMGNYRLFVDTQEATDWEAQLDALRGTSEFKFSIIIAQKGA